MNIGLVLFIVLEPIAMMVLAAFVVVSATEQGMRERRAERERESRARACKCETERRQQSTDSSYDSYDYDPDEAARRLAAHPWWGLR